MKTTYVRIILLILLVLSLVGFLFYQGYVRLNYPSPHTYPIRGIDISYHQGEINWKELEKEDVDFVFIKATEGQTYVDPKFKENWENARQQGYYVGAYHFYRRCKTGFEQAENIIRTVPKGDGMLPIVLDLEFYGNCETDKPKEQIVQEIKGCIQQVKAHYGQMPILYVMTDFYKQYLIHDFQTNPIWIRNIVSGPSLPDREDWAFWQYSNRGRMAGIEGFVDLNVFHGSEEEIKSFSLSQH
ncbi:MAG: GH25 family lysozyme [Bacteroidota bacterium]